MAKFLIQDIMPPEKRKGIKATPPKASRTIHHHPQEEMERAAIPTEPLHQPAPLVPEHQEHAHTDEYYDAGYDQPIPEGYEAAQRSYATPEHGYEESTYQGGSFEDLNREQTSSFGKRLSGMFYAFFRKPEMRSIVIRSLVTIVVLGGAYVAVAEYFGGATIELTPKHTKLTLDRAVFAAQKDPTADSLSYSVMQVEDTEQKVVPATGTRSVTVKASGKIVVYNAYSTSVQRLIKNTRFQVPTGKIYRINESIVVPGMKTSGGKTTPGSVAAVVYADEPGPAYNSDPVDFTIPGLKSDPERYKNIYARSNGPISGGQEGVVKSVSDADMKSAKDELRITLETKLRSKARGNLTDSQVSFENSYLISFDDPALVQDAGGDANAATIAEKGILSAIVFNRDALAKEIAKKQVANYQGGGFSAPQLGDTLKLTMDQITLDDLMRSSTLSFTLTGVADLVSRIPVDEIVKTLAGTQKRAFNSILAQENSVEYAKADISPFWRSSFPTDPKRIKVVVTDDTPAKVD